MNINKIAILASGSGTNAERLVRFFKEDPLVSIDLILSNNKGAFVLERASKLGVKSYSFTREEFYSENFIRNFKDIDLIVLAGFLWLIPSFLVKAFPNKIINIHPALLPAYGGKGMYGMNVHKAVIENGEKESGISIHYVNEKYDEGNIIFQATCTIDSSDTPEILAEKIHQLEYKHFPEVIKRVIEGLG